MTTELYPGPPQYTVNGPGPYAINHEYTIGAIRPVAELDGVMTELSETEFSLDPASGDSGNLYLTVQAAESFDGHKLTINRQTIIEQGWLPSGGAREKGLASQLDRHAQGLQEVQRNIQFNIDLDAAVTAATEAAATAQDAASAIVQNTVAQEEVFEVISADGQSVFELTTAPVTKGRTQLRAETIDGLREVVQSEFSLSGRIVTLDNPLFPPARLIVRYGRLVDENVVIPPASDGTSFPSVSDFKAAIVAGFTAPDGAVVAAGPVQFQANSALAQAGIPDGWVPFGDITSEHFDVDSTGATDASVLLNTMHGNIGRDTRIARGVYRLDNPIRLRSDSRLILDEGAVLQQRGDALFVQDDADLEACHVIGGVLDYQHASPSAWHFAFKLGDHRRCRFDTAFRNYTNASLILRQQTGTGTGNSVDNIYRIVPEAMSDARCQYGIVGIGADALGYDHVGDGTATAINTGIVWPEQLPSSVKVVAVSPGSPAVSKTLGTDYTVSYDGSNVLTVTPAAAIPSGDIWLIDPSQPVSGGRVPITGNDIHIVADPVVVGYMALRWVDGENVTGRFRLDADTGGGLGFQTNPHAERSSQAGDYLNLRDFVLAFTGTFNALTPVYGMDFGPGTTNVRGDGVRMDSVWTQGGVYYGLRRRSGLQKVLSGTVSGTSGSPIVTGTGTAFRSELSLVGSTPDRAIIDGNLYGIASIDSDTQITLSSNLTTSPSGAGITRQNNGDHVSGSIDFAALGSGVTNNAPGQPAPVTWGSSSVKGGQVVIPNGQTTALVNHGMWRAPKLEEITLTYGSNIGSRTLSVNTINATVFQVRMSATIGNDTIVGWRVNLLDTE